MALDEVFESRATEIKAILLTRYTNAHISTFYSVFAENKVRAIWAPYPVDEDEQDKLERLYYVARQNGVDVYVYKSGERLEPFENIKIEHSREYIDRSAVPIDLLCVMTGQENLTYVSPAYNESNLYDRAKFYASRSHYVIFGGRGPNVKQNYGIEDMEKVKTIAFASKTLVGYFDKPEFSFTSYYLVDKEDEMEFYLDK